MSRAGIEILLVEDNEDNIQLTLHALRGENLCNEIHVARDGEEALQFLASRKSEDGDWCIPKLVLLDLELPKVGGLQVLRAIRSNPLTHIVPVVVLTSSKQEADLMESYRLGVNSYIDKPVDFEQFRKMVRQLGRYWLLANQVPSACTVRQENVPGGMML